MGPLEATLFIVVLLVFEKLLFVKEQNTCEKEKGKRNEAVKYFFGQK